MKRYRGPPRTFLPRSAGEAIASALALHGIADEVRAQRLLTDWVDLVGPRIAARTRPDGVTDRILWVEVATSAWLQELNLMRPQLMAGLHARFGEPRVFDELRFKLAGRDRRNATILRAARPARPPRPVVPAATGAARDKILRETQAVDDDELRELIARVRITNDR